MRRIRQATKKELENMPRYYESTFGYHGTELGSVWTFIGETFTLLNTLVPVFFSYSLFCNLERAYTIPSPESAIYWTDAHKRVYK
jgi:hypothetical protein